MDLRGFNSYRDQAAECTLLGYGGVLARIRARAGVNKHCAGGGEEGLLTFRRPVALPHIFCVCFDFPVETRRTRDSGVTLEGGGGKSTADLA